MKFSIPSILLAFTALISAQALPPDLPPCAQACALPFFDSTSDHFADCSTRDVACVCTNTTFISSISCCISQTCNATDQQTAIDFGNNLCSQVVIPGTPPLPTSASCSSSSTPPPSYATPPPSYITPEPVTVTVTATPVCVATTSAGSYRVKGRRVVRE